MIEFAEALKAEADDDGVLRLDAFEGLDGVYSRSGLPAGRRPSVLHTLKRDGYLIEESPPGDPFSTHYRLTSVPEARTETAEIPAQLPPEDDHGPRDADGVTSLPVAAHTGPLPPATRRRGRPKGARTPTQVPWKAPKDQAQHIKAIRESRELKKNARLVAYEAHLQFGLEATARKRAFRDAKKELTPEYLAMFTGLTEKTIRTAMAEACRLGFFHRLDNGKGGRANTNRATYIATVPAWT